VLICDDSPLMRKVLTDLLTDGGLDVVAQLTDGSQLVEGVTRYRPDVVTLDVEMPRMDGLAALQALMAARPTPVVMVSTLTGSGTAASVRALAAGAVDVVQKPALRLTPNAWGVTRDELVEKVVNASRARVSGLATARRAGPAAPAPRPPAIGAALSSRASAANGPLVVIATSTGGPRALHEVVPRLPARLGAGVIIVQHMPVGFTRSLAERLDAASNLRVREALPGDEIRPDTALLVPAGTHLEVTSPGRTILSDAPPVGKLKPRADITISTAARVYRDRLLLVVLTGMGADGLAGAKDVRALGGRILTEDERTCVIYGMPRAVAEAGLSDAVVPLDVMPLAITEAVAGGRRKAA
jgi:two-component system, chemotaxis family, protein-glutamate methylesterase/glutaminase